MLIDWRQLLLNEKYPYFYNKPLYHKGLSPYRLFVYRFDCSYNQFFSSNIYLTAHFFTLEMFYVASNLVTFLTRLET